MNNESRDHIEGKGFQDAGLTSAIKELQTDERLQERPLVSSAEATTYKMNFSEKSFCLIFYHTEFDNKELCARPSAEKDAEKLGELFTKLPFEVKKFKNLPTKQLKETLAEYSKTEDNFERACIVLFFLSHGQTGEIATRDGMFPIRKIQKKFTAAKCRPLAGKPKLFFIQACNGKKYGETVECFGEKYQTKPGDKIDSAGIECYTIPSHADFLTCYSSPPGSVSWNNDLYGSWFMQSLIDVFSSSHGQDDILSLMTSVNRHMVLKYISHDPGNALQCGFKQTAHICSTLMRKIFLPPMEETQFNTKI